MGYSHTLIMQPLLQTTLYAKLVNPWELLVLVWLLLGELFHVISSHPSILKRLIKASRAL